MIRKLLVVAAAIAMPVSAIAATGGLASASNPHTAATDTIVCKDISGTVTFTPKEDSTGYTNQSIKSTISARLTGCTTAGSTHEAVTLGVVTGSLTGTKGTVSKPAGKCSGLIGSSTDAGALSTKWSASPAVPNSVLNVKSVTGGANSKGYGTFTIPGSVKGTAIGSFEGTDHGAKDKSVAQTVLKASALLTTCGSSSGLSKFSITQESGVNAVSLG
jgi:hypothetical protein